MKKDQIPQLSEQEIQNGLLQARSSTRRRHPKILHNHGDEFNRVINFIMHDSYMQTHLHPGPEKIEKIYLLQGIVAILFFNDQGKVTDCIFLEEGRLKMIEVPAFTWHTYVVLSESAITYETMMGIYDPTSWKKFAEYAPIETSSDSVDYLTELKEEALKINIAEDVFRLRISQIIINERIKTGEFKIPIHLALGHEAIAVAVSKSMQNQDSLILMHRNIHYNIARQLSLKMILNEFYLKETGLANGHLGSMNLSNPTKNINYTSSILGNNFSIGSGYALGNILQSKDAVVYIITGDGAIEEGAFYENLLFQKSHNLSTIIIVENNKWSLATEIKERRSPINIRRLANSLNIPFLKLHGNDVFDYIEKLKSVREKSLIEKSPYCVEVDLTTFGFSYKKIPGSSTKRIVNYHSGAASNVNPSEYPIFVKSVKDPLYALERYFGKSKLVEIEKKISSNIEKELL